MNNMRGQAASASHNRILLVEHEPELAQLLSYDLGALQYDVIRATSLRQAGQFLGQSSIDLVLLERMLPDGDGILLCQQLRQAGEQVPLMLLTAKGSEADLVLGLESGADDYLVRPFSILEFRARVRALLRRGQAQKAQPGQLEFNGVHIDCSSREVTAFDKPLHLTAREFDLLLFLAQHPQQVFSRMQLLQAVWGYDYSGYQHTVDSHINRLRNKIASSAEHQQLVKTVWGVGYKFSPPPSSQALEQGA